MIELLLLIVPVLAVGMVVAPLTTTPIASYRARRKRGRRVPGRPTKHGARALARHIRAQTLDRRTWVAQQYEHAADCIAGDAGGWQRLTYRETALVWATAGLLIELQVRQQHRLRELSAGRIDPGADKAYGWLHSTFRRHVEALGLRPERVERQIDALTYSQMTPEERQALTPSQPSPSPSAESEVITDADAPGTPPTPHDDLTTIPSSTPPARDRANAAPGAVPSAATEESE